MMENLITEFVRNINVSRFERYEVILTIFLEYV